MQKQEKSRKPLIIGIIAAVVILAVLLALLLTQCVGGQGNETSVPTTVDPNAVETYELYWNVDRAEYDGKSEAGLSSRMPEEDGYFHVRFIFDGQEVILKVADRKLINSIDVQDVMGLEFDENGIVVGVMNLDDMPLEKVGWQFYVQSPARTMLKLNSSETMNGMEVLLENLDPNRIWDMSGKSGPVGSVAEALEYDKVLAVQNLAGQVTHVFIYQRPNYMLTHEGYCQHCKKDVTWSEWVKEDKIPNMSGHYQLQVDIKNVSQTSLPEDTKLCLDLNGHRIDGKNGARVISMHNAGITLAIMDTSEKQDGVIASHGKTDQGGVVWVRYGAFYLYSGILDASDAYSLHNGVAVECGANKFFYMYGGEIIGGRAAYNYNAEKNTYSAGMGGALAIGGKFVMHDGVIRDGHAEAAVIYKDGKVSNHVRGYGGNIYLSSSAVFEMNGGTIKNGKAGSAGGNIFADGKAELTINGGTISGGLLYGKGKNGGSVNLASKTTTVMNGGSIIGGVSYNCGGNVYLNGTFTMNGGYIGGGVCYNFDTGKVKPTESSANFFNVNGKLYMWGGTIAGGVSVIDSAKNGTQNAVLGLYGVARIDGSTVNRNLTISGSGDGVKVMVSNMYDGAKIGVNTTVGLFTDPTNETYKKYFYSDIEGAEVVYFQERLGLGRVSCICGNSDAETESKTHINGCDGKLLMWAPWTSTNSIPTATGNYYLLNNVTTTKQTVVAAGNDVKLDLNGKDITLKVPATAQDGFRLYRTDGANLAITDTTTTPGTLRTFLPGEDAVYPGKTVKTAAVKDEDGKVIEEAVYFTEEEMRAAWKKGNFGSIFWVRGGTITLHNGIVDASHMEGAQTGMVISINDLTVTDEKTGEKTKYEGVFNMYGGTVIGGYTKSSGNIAVNGSTEMNIYGGTITDGRANAGGNIYINGILNMYGGTVQNGKVDRSDEAVDGGAGGNINIDTAGTLNLYSGTIAGGYSRGGQKGGGHGGNIHVYGKLNATGGVIRDGETPAAGGNIGTIGSAAEIILDGVQVLNGKAGNGGNIGILVRTNKGLHILGETVISGGVATGSKDAGGGNISISLWANGNDRDQIVVIDGGTIDGGLSRCYGGNIFVLNKTSDKFTTDEKTGAEKQTAYEVQVNVTMKSGAIKGGMNGVTDGDITAARGKYNGGSVYLSKRTTFTVEDGTITGGDTTDIGGNIYTNGQLTIKGGTIEEGLHKGTKAASSNIAVVDGNLTISGGVIGGNVAITPTSATGCKVILSGKPVVKQDVAGLCLNAYSSYLPPVIEIQGTLEEGSSVAVNGAGYISTTTPEANHKFFNSTSDAVLYHNERLFIGRSYCICGASLTEGKEHKQFEDKNGKLVGCDGTLQAWAKWTKTNALPTTAGMSDGYYYLGNDVTAVGGQQQIAANTHIRLDLNGMKSLRTNGGRQYSTWNTGSNLTITDSVGTGLMKSTTSNATTDQGIIWGRYGTVTLYGGTIDASEFTLKNAWTYNTEKSKWEGQRSGTAINAGTFNMFGGEIIGGKTEQYAVENLSGVMEWMDGTTGGAVGVSGTFNMFAGTIRDGQSGSTGGNVQVDGTFNMYGGEILNGSINKDGTLRGDLAYGGNVYANNMYMYGGLISGGQVQLPSKSATDENKAGGGGLGGNISVGTRFEAYGGVIENGYAHTGGNYGSNGGSVVVLLDGVQLLDGEAIGAGGNLAINVRVCKSVTITANSVLSGGIAGSNGGNIYLEARNGQGRGYGQGSVAPMNITISGKVEKGQAGGNGGNIYLHNADQTDDTKQDTVNLILDGATIDGGIVENNKTSGEAKGGNIFLVRVNAEIKDSQILNGRVVRNNGVKDQHADGGNIFVSTAAVNITGSTITGGYAQSAPAKAEKKDGDKVIQAAEYFYARGGNIYFYNVNGFIDSTTIADGVAHGAGESGRGYAGNIYLQAATIEMRNGSKVLDGTTTSEKSGWSPSGNMFIASTSNVTVTDTEISGGNGRSSSNNIYLNEPKSTLTLGKGALVHNTVSGATVNICYRAGNLNILDGAVISNAEGITCRNIDYINEDNGVFTMSGGLITGGRASSAGGNLRFGQKTAGKTMTATMSGGVIENGYSNSNGGNLYISDSTTMTIKGDAKVIGGSTNDCGGNININGALTVSENVEISGGIRKGQTNTQYDNIFIVNGDLNVTGGFIDGGITANDTSATDDKVVELKFSGKPVISSNGKGITLDGGIKYLTLEGTLENGSEIWINEVGIVTNATTEANLQYVHHATGDILFVKSDMINTKGGFAAADENKIFVGRCACVCGASVTGGKHVSFKDKNGTTQGCDGTLLKWTPWESTTDIPNAAGNWYLVNPVTRTAATDRYFNVAGLTYRLNLNGKTVTFKPDDGNARLFRIVDAENIYITVTDFDKSGKTDNGKVVATCTSGAQDGTIFWLTKATHKLDIYGGTFDAKAVKMADGKGGTVIQQNNGVVNQFGGTLVGGKSGANANGGNLRINVPATYNLFNGNIIGGEAVYKTEGGQGGNVVVYGTLNMYGGTIKDGISRNNDSGNNIMATSSGGNIAKLNIYGGTIAGGVSFNNATGQGELTLAGKVIIDRSLTSDGVAKPVASLNFGASQPDINVSGLTEGSRIYIYTSGKFGINANETIKGYFHSEKTDGEVVLHNGTELHMGKVYCLCGATKTGSTTHAYWCDGKNLSWIEWNKGNITVSGNYYAPVSTDNTISYTGQKTVYEPDITVNFDLNGQQLISTNERAFTVRNGAHFSITDTVGNGSIAGTKKQNAGTIHVLRSTSADKQGTRDTVLNLYAGTFTFAGETATSGAVIDAAGIEGFGRAIVNMYGGTITGGKGTNGGNISVGTEAEVNLYEGAVVTGGTAYNGGNLYVDGTNAKVTLHNGSMIENGTATRELTTASGEYTLGGNVYIKKGTVTVNEGASVSGGKTAASDWSAGGNFHIKNGGILNVNGGTVTAGDGASEGNNIYMDYGAVVNMTAGKIENTVSNRKENIKMQGGTLTIDGGSVVTSEGVLGRNIHTNNNGIDKGQDENLWPVINLNAGEITGGKITASDANGGSLYLCKAVTLNMKGGKISGGTSGHHGGNIYTNGVLNITGGEISGGSAATSGNSANIFAVSGRSITISGGMIDGGINYGGSATPTTLKGKPVIKATNGGLNQGGTALIVEGTLENGSEVNTSGSGFVTGDTVEANLQYFHSTKGYGEHYVEGKIFFGKVDCLCGSTNGNHTDGCIAAMSKLGLDATKGDKLAYKPLTAFNDMNKGGAWYLHNDLTSAGRVEINNMYVVLDLNDKTLTSTQNNILFTTQNRTNATLIITDTSANGEGILKHSTTAGTTNQGVIRLWYGATNSVYMLGGTVDASGYELTTGSGVTVDVAANSNFYMYGGKLIGTAKETHTGNGGTVQLNGNFEMFGGEILGGRAGLGGNVNINLTGHLKMHGGLISGGIATENGSNVNVLGAITMDGGEIEGGVYVNSANAVFTKGATISKGGNYSLKVAEGNVISVKDLTGTIYVTAEPGNAFATNATIDHEKNVISEVYKSGKQVPVTYQGGQLYMGVPSMVYCLCGVDSDNAADHVDGCDGTKYQWILWDSTNTLPTEEGNYKLVYTINLEKVETPVAGSTIRIDLNGQKINLTDNENMYDLVDDGDVTIVITDASQKAEGEVVITGNSTQAGGILQVRKTNDLHLYRATLNASGLTLERGTDEVNGVGVFVDGGATFTMHSGKILGGHTVRGCGGSVTVNGKFTMLGGIISGGSTGNWGGNIGAWGEVELLGGTVTGGVAKQGGNIGLQGGKLTTKNVVISNGSANALVIADTAAGGQATKRDGGVGGNIYAFHNGGTIDLGEGTVIVGGRAAIGGNLNVSANNIKGDAASKVITIDGAKILGGIAAPVSIKDKDGNAKNDAGTAGNIYIANKQSVTFESGFITGGDASANGSGANVYVEGSGSFTMNGGSIGGETTFDGTDYVGGRGKNNGGSARVTGGSASFTMNGGEIVNGLTTDSGANLLVSGNASFTMTDGVIKNGTAKTTNTAHESANVFVQNAHINVSGGEIWGGLAVQNYSVTNNWTPCTIELSGDAVIDGTLNATAIPSLALWSAKATGITPVAQEPNITIVGELSDKASIGLYESDRVFTVSADFAEASKDAFFADNGAQEVIVLTEAMVNESNGKLTTADIGKLYIGQYHCLCGGLVEGTSDICDHSMHIWYPISSRPAQNSNGDNTSAYYYLTKSFEKTSGGEGGYSGSNFVNRHIYIDLNGFDITADQSMSRFLVIRGGASKCSVNLVNTKEKDASTIIMKNTRDQGSLVWFSGGSNNTCRLFNVDVDVQITNAKKDGAFKRHGGGVISVGGSGSKLYMEKVNFFDNRNVDSGYAGEFVSVGVYGYAKDCTFTGANGTAAPITVSGANVILENCTVENNIGGGVDLSANVYSKLILKGSTTITNNTNGDAARNVYLNVDGAKVGSIQLDASFTGAFGLSGAEDVVVIPGAKTSDSNVSGYITADDASNKLADLDAGIILTNNDNRIQCECGGKAVGVGDHQCELVIFKPWTKSNDLPSSGNWYLTSEDGVEITAQDSVDNAITLRIDLNGKSIESSSRIFLLDKNATLSITDSTKTAGTITGKSASNGGVFLVMSYPEGNDAYTYVNFNLYNGTIAYAGTKNSEGGVLDIGTGATFNMYGGVITDGKAAGDGGNVIIRNGGIFNNYNGTIQNGQCGYGDGSGNGGNVCIYNGGTYTMSGGKVTGGKCTKGQADNYAANPNQTRANVDCQGRFVISGGEITGRVTLRGGSGHISGNPKIDGSNAFNVENATAGANLEIGVMTQGAKIQFHTSKANNENMVRAVIAEGSNITNENIGTYFTARAYDDTTKTYPVVIKDGKVYINDPA